MRKTALELWIFLLFLPATLQAAPCCTGSALVPTLITTDSNAQVSVRASHAAVVGNSRSDGSSVFNRAGNDESTTSFEVAAAYAVTPRFQIHTQVPVSRRYRGIDDLRGSDFDVGDVSAGLAYELVQELRYEPVKPRVWIFLDGTAPTGKSIYDDDVVSSPLALGVHGRGVWAVTAGIFAQKNFKLWGQYWDVLALAEHRRHFARDVGETTVTLGPMTVLDVGAGYHLGDWRLGLSVGPSWEGATRTSSGIGSVGRRLWWNVSAQVSYAWAEVWAVAAFYNDQTLLGPTYNAVLSRGGGLSLMRRFE